MSVSTIQYLKFLTPWITAIIISTIGMYAHLKFPNVSMLTALLMALPFAWINWVFMTLAMDINNKHKIFTPTQDTMFLIITQYIVLLILNSLYLKQKVSLSDLIALPIMLLGFAISGKHLFSKLLGIKNSS